jgi:hypothetical protein
MEHSYVNYKLCNKQVLKSVDNYLYSNAKRTDAIQYLRCVIRECPGTGKLKRDQNEFAHMRAHNHGPEKYQIHQNQLAVNLRQKAACPSHNKDTLKDLFKESTREHDYGAEISFGHLESGMLKARRKVHPRTPDSIPELIQVLLDNPATYGLNYKCEVSAGGESALIFIHEASTNRLHKVIKVNFDGTFLVCPHPFKQLWTVLGEIEGRLFPLFSVLMNSKTTDLYRVVLQKIKEMFPAFQPQHAMGDFEIAPRTALREAFQGIHIVGCQFHLANNLYKKVGQLELRGLYASDPQFKKWIRAIMALPFLPARLIAQTFEILKQQIAGFPAEVQPKMQTFQKYFKKVYLTQNTADDISIYRLSRGTNNEQEGYHAVLRNIFKVKPSLFVFLLKLNRDMEDVAQDIIRAENGLRLGRSRKQKDIRNARRHLELWLELDSGRRTPLSFLHAISHTMTEQIECDRDYDDDLVSDDEPDQGDAQDNAPAPQPPGRECVVCTEPREAPFFIFLPCGHGRCCVRCMDRIAERGDFCPECRTPITGRNRAIIE